MPQKPLQKARPSRQIRRVGAAGRIVLAAGLTLGGIGVGIESARTSDHADGQGIVGDVNCNGEINSIDAALVLQRTAGLIDSLACEQAGDVNGDHILNAIDAALILQYSAGLIDELPAKEEPTPTAPAATRTPEPTPTKDGCGEAAGIEEGATYVDVCATKTAQTSTPIRTPTRTAEITATSTASPTETPIPFEDLSPRDKIITYASEVLNPNYLPKDFSGEPTTEVFPQWEERLYYMDFVVNGVEIGVYYWESIRGSNFEEDGIPLAMNIATNHEGVNARELAPDNIRDYLGGFFNFTEDPISWREFTLSGLPIIETSWDNPDGTIETRGSRRYGRTLPYGTTNSQNVACRLFPRLLVPPYELRSCFV